MRVYIYIYTFIGIKSAGIPEILYVYAFVMMYIGNSVNGNIMHTRLTFSFRYTSLNKLQCSVNAVLISHIQP